MIKVVRATLVQHMSTYSTENINYWRFNVWLGLKVDKTGLVEMLTIFLSFFCPKHMVMLFKTWPACSPNVHCKWLCKEVFLSRKACCSTAEWLIMPVFDIFIEHCFPVYCKWKYFTLNKMSHECVTLAKPLLHIHLNVFFRALYMFKECWSKGTAKLIALRHWCPHTREW